MEINDVFDRSASNKISNFALSLHSVKIQSLHRNLIQLSFLVLSFCKCTYKSFKCYQVLCSHIHVVDINEHAFHFIAHLALKCHELGQVENTDKYNI